MDDRRREPNVRTVVLPAKNRADIDELPERVRQGIDIRLVDAVSEVVDIVLA